MGFRHNLITASASHHPLRQWLVGAVFGLHTFGYFLDVIFIIGLRCLTDVKRAKTHLSALFLISDEKLLHKYRKRFIFS